MLSQKFRLVLLLDMDGVLVETEGLHVAKTMATALKYGVVLPERAFHEPQTFLVPNDAGLLEPKTMRLYGAGDKNIYHWAATQKPDLRERLSMQGWLGELMDYYIAHKERIKPRDGILSMLGGFHERGTLLAVNTSGIAEQVKTNFTALPGLQEKLCVCLTANDIKKTKPDPESYNTVRSRIWSMQKHLEAKQIITPGETFIFVAVEDSGSGHGSTYGAGLPCVQYLLDGQKPVWRSPTASYGKALTAQELSREIVRLFEVEVNKRLITAPRSSPQPWQAARCVDSIKWPIVAPV